MKGQFAAVALFVLAGNRRGPRALDDLVKSEIERLSSLFDTLQVNRR